MPVPGTSGQLANILAYWHAVEMFDPHDIPSNVEPLNVVRGQPLPMLPWQPGHPRYDEAPRAGRYGSVWQHTVYGGIFDFAAVRAALATQLGYSETEDFGGRLRDAQSALFAFTVDERGVLLANSTAFSSCAWATGRLYRPGAGTPGWLDGFAEQTSECEWQFAELLTCHMRYFRATPGSKDPGWRKTVTAILGPAAAGAVSSVISALAPALGGAGSLLQRAPQPQAEPVSPEQPGPGLLLPDVIAFAAHVADRFALPPGLARHLELRIVSTPRCLSKDGSRPDPEPVFLSSPVAPDLRRVADSVARGDVGPALRSYLSSPLPPERRSDILTDRPALLRGLSPDAFPPGRWPQDAGKPLVAGQQFAVNTILSEAGGLFAVNGPPGTGKTTLLRDLIAAIVVARAERLACLARPEDAFLPQPTWWKSGSGGQRHAWRPDPGLAGFEILVTSFDNAAVENITKELPLLTAFGEMRAILRELESSPPPSTDWHAAAQRFSAAVRAEQAFRQERAAAWKSRCSPVSEDSLRAAAEQVRVARAEYDDSLSLHEQASHDVGICASAAARSQEEQRRHEAARPGGLTGRLGVGDYVRRWRARAGELVTAAGAADVRLRSAQSRRDDVLTLVAERRTRLMQTEAAAANLAVRQADDLSRVSAARRDWGSFFPESWLDLDQAAQELASPWSDPDWSAARTRVFLAALDLHRAFIAGAAGKIRKNLLSLFDLLKRDSDAPSTPSARAAVWQTMFLVVPVISTTFASCGRIFEGLGPQSLGWVLIDEAGQALPQHAAGSLWRARRAVVVGDPLQLEPICQVPGQAQERLREFFGVDPRWLPSAGSAQTLADEQNRWGTDAGERWVGAPLRVHRRCQQPMFDVSNTIAYQGRMVYGTREVPFPCPESCWLDVSGPSSGTWVPAQGDAMLAILRRLHANLDDVYVLSPFRDVVKGCRDAVRRLLADDFVHDRIGTVHTMQGKEADVVIMVLGTDPSPGQRAREWAADPVNFLNVAVSRARRRLFVIGSREEWSEAPNFAELARRLPVHRWPPSD